ncbi:hypothetical protein DMUE_1133 [Dictyocoela muelleri]|nr:hypothetical protein DMUE_1133 [Dictyocoela muelleri]
MQEKQPKYIIRDFEKAPMSEFIKIFKNTKIYNCYFHFTQIIWRFVKKNGLVNKYKSNNEFRNYVKMILSIAFVPKDKQLQEYDRLKMYYLDKFKEKPEIDFLIYFENNFLKKNRNAIGEWGCCERVLKEIILTTNLCEGFNRSLNSLLVGHHPSLSKIIIILRTQDHLQDKKISESITLQTGTNTKTKRKYMALKRIIERYDEYFDIFF